MRLRALVTLAIFLIALGVASTTSRPVAAATPLPAAPAPAWPFDAMGVPADRPTGDGVTVAIVDSGIDRDHPAFAGRITAVVDCVGSHGDERKCRTGGRDENGHGTHIAGIVAAAPTVAGAPEGIAPGASILAVRALTHRCSADGAPPGCRALGDLPDVVAAVRWAVGHGADFVNLSIDAGIRLDWDDGELASAIEDAWRRGVVVVASTGNRGVTIDDDRLASVPMVLVAALDSTGRPAAYTNRPGPARWALYAPGGEAGGACPDAAIESTFPRAIAASGEGCLAGTSMAAAYVTGSLAAVSGTGLAPAAALDHVLATASSVQGDGSPAKAVDLGAALGTPPSAADLGHRNAAHAANRPANALDADAERVASATTTPGWPARHPVRTRALALSASLLLVAVALALGDYRSVSSRSVSSRGSSTAQIRSLTSSTGPRPSTRKRMPRFS